MKNINCVQCKREMTQSYSMGGLHAPLCSYPECPNYAILQTGILPEETK